MLDLDEMRRRLDIRPFQPFRLVASNGEQFVVERSQDAFLTAGANLHFGFNIDEQSGIPRKGAMLNLAQIVSLEVVGDPMPPKEPGFEGDPFKRPGED